MTEKEPWRDEYDEFERQKKILMDGWTMEQHQEYKSIVSNWNFYDNMDTTKHTLAEKAIHRKELDKRLNDRIRFEKETGLIDIAKDFAKKMAKKYRIGFTMPQ
jgi:hypothetical protein